ncbi:MAG: hypothetical protein GEU28_09065 [Dehalococcoidia bacterium]|nr:hypothetical protein [Dehalococcoidia bacterium]
MSHTGRARVFHLPALLAILAGAGRNEAVGWLEPPGAVDQQRILTRFGRDQLPLSTRSALAVSHDGVKPRALAGGRARAGSAVWEVDILIAPEPAAAAAALDQLAITATDCGARRITMRLAMDSPALEAARSAGYMPYAAETLFAASSVARSTGPRLDFRVAGSADAHGLFMLYNRAVPQEVRAREAITLEEWSATLNPIGVRHPAQFVVESEGEIVGWLRSAQRGSAVTFDVLVDPFEDDLAVRAVDGACALLGPGHSLRFFVPTYMQSMERRLEARGFFAAGEFALLSRQLAVPIAELARAQVAEKAAWVS